MILMIAPGADMTLGTMPSGASYVSDELGLVRIYNDSAADQTALAALGCYTLSPFGGWGTFGFDTLADLYAADLGALLPGITGFPRWSIASIFSDPASSNDGTWCKTGSGNGSGYWTQVSTLTLAWLQAEFQADFQLLQQEVLGLNAPVHLAAGGTAAAATTGALPSNTYSNGVAGVGATLTATANGALPAQDGITLTAGQRLLVRNEATAANNGLYVVTQVGDSSHPYILTRASDANAPILLEGIAVMVAGGTTQSGIIYVLPLPSVVVGTTALAFVSGAPLPGTTVTYDTLAAFTAAFVPSTVNTVRVAGCLAYGDGGDVVYARASAGAAAGKVQTADLAWWQLVDSGNVNLLQFGGVRDGIKLTDGVMASGSSTLTSGTASWSNADVGKIIRVRGAGSSGADASGTITACSGPGSITVSFSNTSGAALAGAQIDFGTDNYTALTNALAFAGSVSKQLRIPRGRFYTSLYTKPADNCRIYGDGHAVSHLGCIGYNASYPQAHAALWLGNWHLNAQGERPHGSSGPFTRLINMYAASGVCHVTDTQVTMATPANASYFTVGSIYYLRSQEATTEDNGVENFDLPIQNALVKVTYADPTTGIVKFEKPIGFTSQTAPWLCAIQAGANDGLDSVYFSQGILIENVSLGGECLFGGPQTGAYNCTVRNCGGDVDHIIRCNGMAWCVFESCHVQFRGVGFELKFCSHNSRITGLKGECNYAATSTTTQGVGMIALGEYTRDMMVLDFTLDAPSWNAGNLVMVQTGTGCTLRGKINAPSGAATPVELVPDPMLACQDNDLDLYLIHGAQNAATIYLPALSAVPGATVVPTNNRIKVRSRYVGAGTTLQSIVINGGVGNWIAGCEFTNSGPITVGAGVSGNRIKDNITDNLVVNGGGYTTNYVGPNYYRNTTTGEISEFSVMGRVIYGSTPPTTGSWNFGDRMVNTIPGQASSQTSSDWVCIAAGSPGTWVPRGTTQQSGAYSLSSWSLSRTLNASTATLSQVANFAMSIAWDLQQEKVFS